MTSFAFRRHRVKNAVTAIFILAETCFKLLFFLSSFYITMISHHNDLNKKKKFLDKIFTQKNPLKNLYEETRVEWS